MRGTMTWVGMDVHARSTHGAAIDSLSGELQRVRFGAGTEEVVGWLAGLRAPVRAVYEAGPTGFGLARAAQRAGIEVMIAAPSRPRARPAIASRATAATPSRWRGCCWPASLSP